MNRSLPLIPIALGAVAGALVALLQAPKKAAPVNSEARAPVATAPLPRTETHAAQAAPQASAPAPVASPATSATAVGNPAAPAASTSATANVFDLSEPETEQALLDAQIACNRSIPDACERAARALESGRAGTKDPTRARSLKRIALTIYVKQCEASRPAACARLAEMYEVGETVQKSEKSVQGLRARVAELCKARPNEPGCPPQ
ncbi:MAG: hypothetical protein ACOY0T_01755 [Myxococcota bacterium]